LATISRWPSTTLVSLATAWVLSRVLTLAAIDSDSLIMLFFSRSLKRAMASSTSRWEYQTSSVGEAANSRIAPVTIPSVPRRGPVTPRTATQRPAPNPL
jgi:hypothetical protein